MSKFINPDLLKQIEKHEGRRKTVYKDSLGHDTIGIGHLVSKPLHDDVIDFIFLYDIHETIASIKKKQPWILEPRAMNQVKRNMLVEMVFNLGINRFGKFKKMIKAAKAKDWQTAHDEALDSLWAKQVKGRAKTLAKQILNG